MTDPAMRVAVVRQRLPVPPEVVFDEWTDAARLAEWMCPRPARCLNVEADPRIGGTVAFEVEEAGTTFRVSGNYLTLERPHRVAFTWSCSTWPDPAIQSVVTVTIEPDGAEGSVMTIEHRLLPPDLLQRHAQGWAIITTQLESRLRSTGSGTAVKAGLPVLADPHRGRKCRGIGGGDIGDRAGHTTSAWSR